MAPKSGSKSSPQNPAPDFGEVLEHFLAAPEDQRSRLLHSLAVEVRAEVERVASLEGTVSPGFLPVEEPAGVDPVESLPATIDRYEPERRLARTAFSQVFLARDLVSRQRVALKLLPPFGAADDRIRKFFFREIRALQKLEHPNVVVIHGSGESGEGPYIVTEFLRGHNLGEWLTADASRPYADRLGVARQVAVALEAVHAAGLVHGDVKPSNVFVESNGNVKLLDFGTARRLESLVGSLSSRAGTPAYIAPEMLREGKLSRQADMFSFGVLCFELMTGANPLRRDSMAETFRAVVEATLPVGAVRQAGASQSVAAMLKACLGKDASTRPADFSEIVRALDA